jgi:hypothetical protein
LSFSVECYVVVFVVVFIKFADCEEYIFEVGVTEAVGCNFVLVFFLFDVLEHRREQCFTVFTIFGTFEVNSYVGFFNDFLVNEITNIFEQFILLSYCFTEFNL